MYNNKETTLAALFAAGMATVVSAQSGNAIYWPGLNNIVPAGKQYDIGWDSTKPYSGGTVTLVLLKGPSTNVVPIQTLVANTANNGVFTWYPGEDLEDSCGGTGYGLKIIMDGHVLADGSTDFQYSTQFGISNPKNRNCPGDETSSTTSSAAATSEAATSEAASATSETAAATSAASVKAENVETSAAAASAALTTAPYPVVTPAGNSSNAVVTEVVYEYTTFCPYATSLTMGGKTYTVSASQTLTVTDCGSSGCTITRTNSPAAPTGARSQGISLNQPKHGFNGTIPAYNQPAAGNGNGASQGASSGSGSSSGSSSGSGSGSVSGASVPGAGAGSGSGSNLAATPVGTPVATPMSTPWTGAASGLKVSGAFAGALVAAAAFFAL